MQPHSSPLSVYTHYQFVELLLINRYHLHGNALLVVIWVENGLSSSAAEIW